MSYISALGELLSVQKNLLRPSGKHQRGFDAVHLHLHIWAASYLSAGLDEARCKTISTQTT